MLAYNAAIENTVFEFTPKKSGPLLIVLVVSLLFTAAQPEATNGMPLLARFTFWFANVSLAIAAILLASAVLSNRDSLKSSPFVKVLLTGLLASLIAAPLCHLMDTWLPPSHEDGDWLDQLEQQGLIWGSIAEFISVLPILLPTWLLMNFPFIMRKSQNTKAEIAPEDSPKHVLPSQQEIQQDSQGREQQQEQEGQQEQEAQQEQTQQSSEHKPDYVNTSQERLQFFDNLPKIIGKDIVAMSSQSHYINVQTTQGSCLVLGSIKRCADFMGEEGMLTHRSNWVAKKHVERIHISSKTAYCLTTNGLKVPISRSRRKEVKQVFGQAKVH